MVFRERSCAPDAPILSTESVRSQNAADVQHLSAKTLPEQDLSQYLSYLLACANRHMRIGLTNSIGDEEFTEEHWRILQVLSDE